MRANSLAALSIPVLLLSLQFLSSDATAKTRPAVGFFASGMTSNISQKGFGPSWDVGGGGGFFVELPLMKSFHLSPGARFERCGALMSSEMDMNLRFVIPTEDVALFFALGPGVQTHDNRLHGVLSVGLGAWTRLAGDVAFFGEGRFAEYMGAGYREVFGLSGGLLFFL